MDKTIEYIKMCDKATELHKQCQYETDDWFSQVTGYSQIDGSKMYELHVRLKCNISFAEEGTDKYRPFIWLPRQNQLQKMIGSFNSEDFENVPVYACPKYMVEDLFEFAQDDCKMGLTSMEQLWLAFVMKEKFNKTWDGEDWNE